MDSNCAQSTFRFLDLPKDLRLMVYEELDRLRHHHDKIELPIPGETAAITLITPRVYPTFPHILLTLHLIYDEATIIPKKRYLKSQHGRSVPRMIIPAKSAATLVMYNGIIDETMNWLHYVHMLPYVTLDVKQILDNFQGRAITFRLSPTSLRRAAE